MTDEQFQKLRTLILDVKVGLAANTLAIRKLAEAVRAASVEVDISEIETPQDVNDLLKTLLSPEPRSDS